MRKTTKHIFRDGPIALSFVIPLLFLSTCAVKKPPSASQAIRDSLPATTTIPGNWTSPDTSSAAVETGWLKSFNDPPMEAIVTESLKNNLDLQAAATRIVVAANIVTEVRAQMLPIIGISGTSSGTGLYSEPGGFLTEKRSSELRRVATIS
jgi:outer membrane protein TolC